jgi:hypothetical protein
VRSNPVSKGAKYLLTPTSFAQDKISSCKAEEGGDAVASLTEVNCCKVGFAKKKWNKKLVCRWFL